MGTDQLRLFGVQNYRVKQDLLHLMRGLQGWRSPGSWLQGLPAKVRGRQKAAMVIVYFEQWFPKLVKLLDHLGEYNGEDF